jgi:beta-lactam-binding protein with PASTA domain
MKFRRHFPVASNVKQVFTKGSPAQKQQVRELKLSLRNAGFFFGAAVFGYLVAALVLFRSPIFAQTRVVPRVMGMSADSARAALTKAELSGKVGDHINHPTAPPGQVVWQDPPPDVIVPSGATVDLAVSDGAPRVLVPDVAGYGEADARTLIESAGLTASVENTQTSAPKGVVVNTRPPSGTALTPGRPVTLVVSVGAPTMTVPDVVGMQLQEAKAKIEEAGFKSGTSLSRSTTVADPGVVIEQRPQAGTLGAPGTAVDLVVARKASP